MILKLRKNIAVSIHASQPKLLLPDDNAISGECLTDFNHAILP